MTTQPLHPAALADIRRRDHRGIDDPQRVAQDREVLLIEVDRLAAEVATLRGQADSRLTKIVGLVDQLQRVRILRASWSFQSTRAWEVAELDAALDDPTEPT